MELQGKNIVVIGLAKTGLATVEFLLARGARVTATDMNPEALAAAAPPGLKTAPYDPETVLRDAELVVPSPGVPPVDPILTAAVAKDIPIMSELELAGRFLRIPMVAVTGTNGKTTTTSLIGHILARCGRKVFVGGNIGAPLIGYVGGPQSDDWAVIEVSSFQLQWSELLHPAVAVLLNVTVDHLDYHHTFIAYRVAKERLFTNQTAADTTILNGDDPGTKALLRRLGTRILRFSSTSPVIPGMYAENDTLLHVSPEGEKETYPRSLVKLPGNHNLENVMAAVLAARSCGCDPEGVAAAVASFAGIPHRLEYVGERRGVSFYDDSKGTNVDAVFRALATFTAPVVLLMGGRDKAGDFRPLISVLKEKAKRLVLFGEARETIGAVIGGIVPTESCPTLREGIATAAAAAAPGDVVLLSPGCASFDEFRDYKARGRFFQEQVKALAHD